jgi:hypothetical protein
MCLANKGELRSLQNKPRCPINQAGRRVKRVFHAKNLREIGCQIEVENCLCLDLTDLDHFFLNIILGWQRGLSRRKYSSDPLQSLESNPEDNSAKKKVETNS